MSERTAPPVDWQAMVPIAEKFAVGRASAGFGALVLYFQHSQCLGIVMGSEAHAIIRHHPPDLDAVAAKEAQGVEQEGQAGLAGLVGEYLGTGQAGVVIDRQMQTLPALAAVLARPCVALAAAVAHCPTGDRLQSQRGGIRWPMPSIRPSFLMSIWIISPGVSFSQRMISGLGSSANKWLKQRDFLIRATVARDKPTEVAIFQNGWRRRRRASTLARYSPVARFCSLWGRLERSASPATPSEA